jgi:hypothetical protein
MKTLRFLSLLIGITGTLHAQKAEPPPLPSGPLIKRAPDFAQWTYSFIFSTETPKTGDKSAVSEHDVNTVVVKTGTMYHVQSIDGIGMKIEKWIVGNMQVTIVPNAKFPSLSTGASIGDPNSDFTGFDWISPKNYTGVEKVRGLDCYVFRSKIKAKSASTIPELDMNPKEKVEVVACIDMKSLLPISLQSGESMTTYRYGQTPSAKLVPPANVQALIDNYNMRLKQAAMMPPP